MLIHLRTSQGLTGACFFKLPGGNFQTNVWVKRNKGGKQDEEDERGWRGGGI